MRSTEANLTLQGQSIYAQRIARRIQLLAQSDTPVIIYGPKGSGHADVARVLARESKRADKPYIACHCGDPSELLDRKLFLGDRVASGLEHCAGGTVFFEQITEASPGLLFKIAQLIEDQSIIGANVFGNVRVILGVQGDELPSYLEPRVLSAFDQPRIELYDLDDRESDLPEMIRFFCETRGASLGVPKINPLATRWLCERRWKGNVLELEDFLNRACAVAKSYGFDTLQIDFFERVVEKILKEED